MTTSVVTPYTEPSEPRSAGLEPGKTSSISHFFAKLGAGAQFGYGLLWTMLLSHPLMAAIQEICAHIGRVTGCGLAANLRTNYPRSTLYFVLIATTVPNVFHRGADIGAMAASLALIVPANVTLLTVTFGIIGEGCNWRVSLEKRPLQAVGFYNRHRHCHRDRIALQLSPHRPCEGTLLGCNSQRSRRSTAHGRNHDDGLQSESDAEICDSSLPEMGWVVCHRCHALLCIGVLLSWKA